MKKQFIILFTLLPSLYAWEGKSTLTVTDDTRFQFDSFEIEQKLRTALLNLCEDCQVEENAGVCWVHCVMHTSLKPLFNVQELDVRTLEKDLLDQCMRQPVPNGSGALWQASIIETIIALVESSSEYLGTKRLRENRIKKQNSRRRKKPSLIPLPIDVLHGYNSASDTDSI